VVASGGTFSDSDRRVASIARIIALGTLLALVSAVIGWRSRRWALRTLIAETDKSQDVDYRKK
jgi:adenylylsulfate kinase-like enzyme